METISMLNEASSEVEWTKIKRSDQVLGSALPLYTRMLPYNTLHADYKKKLKVNTTTYSTVTIQVYRSCLTVYRGAGAIDTDPQVAKYSLFPNSGPPDWLALWETDVECTKNSKF